MVQIYILDFRPKEVDYPLTVMATTLSFSKKYEPITPPAKNPHQIVTLCESIATWGTVVLIRLEEWGIRMVEWSDESSIQDSAFIIFVGTRNKEA